MPGGFRGMKRCCVLKDFSNRALQRLQRFSGLYLVKPPVLV